jgi:hypothetical protein
MICTKCGAAMDQTDKSTFTGREIREYACRSCGHTDWEDCGTALWQILHDDREEFEAAQAAREAANAAPAQSDPPKAGQSRPRSLWQRLIGVFGK